LKERGLEFYVKIKTVGWYYLYENRFTSIFITMLFGIMLVSCNSTQKGNTASNTENPPTPSKESTPTKFATSTTTPTVESTLVPRPTPTPRPTTFADATLEAFGYICSDSGGRGTELSPNGKWITANCISENGTEDSPLVVISLDHSKKWRLYYRDYVKESVGAGYDHHDSPMPYRWSKDGRFLYILVGSRFEGCCWKGHRYTLLLRLSLETGTVVEFLNATDLNAAFPFDFIISDSDRYLFFTPPTNQPYSFAILDLQTGNTQTVSQEFPGTIDLYYARISPDENKIVIPLFKFYEETLEYKFDSLALFDMSTGEQRLIIKD
jgi:hypothetical protein